LTAALPAPVQPIAVDRHRGTRDGAESESVKRPRGVRIEWDLGAPLGEACAGKRTQPTWMKNFLCEAGAKPADNWTLRIPAAPHAGSVK
jgi:hypothetical protein